MTNVDYSNTVIHFNFLVKFWKMRNMVFLFSGEFCFYLGNISKTFLQVLEIKDSTRLMIYDPEDLFKGISREI